MDIWEIDKLILFLLFVIPGFISLKIYELVIPNEQKETSKQLIDAIAYSCINYAILFIPIIYIETMKKDNTINSYLYYFFYLFVFIIAPIIWVIILKWLRERELFQKIAPHPTLKPWDYVFKQRKPYWIKITLINGQIIGGKYSTKSFASSSPAKEQIYLEESWVINANGGFERKKNDTEGIIVMSDQISLIEFRKFNRS
jgi:hypothetical protein